MALIPDTVRRPSRLFRGLRRAGMEQALCYVAFPSHRYTEGNNQVPALAGAVFLVFVDATARIFEWRWELPSADGVDLETFFRTRFDEEIRL